MRTRRVVCSGKEAKADDMRDAKRALTLLGGKLESIKSLELPGVADTHFLVTIQKIAFTPSAYPRKPGTPSQNPLA